MPFKPKMGASAKDGTKRNLEAFFARLGPEGSQFEHDAEGPDDMPAHIRASLTQTSVVFPVMQGRLAVRCHSMPERPRGSVDRNGMKP
ncbi:MAG: hypothetical protein HOI34_13995 [Rhodospirillaceae bacterium]|nr:hypothetical protein [Rhodospirillaceae bacterium]MBT6204791.1 hypothetical protein [Rhodospirillaceae bacterium]MBT6509057.1 hypothetical protein [Rhodospirillaceae bacterium]